MRNAVSVLTFVACFAVPGLAHAQAVADPWEGFNRRMFAVHEAVDQAVLEPVARGYRAVTPQPVRTGVQNFLRNLKAPVIFINDVLQGEIGRAGTTAARLGSGNGIDAWRSSAPRTRNAGGSVATRRPAPSLVTT